MFGIESFRRDILNNSGLREILREKIPAIDLIEGLDGLKELELISINTHPYLDLSYEATAMAGFYPGIKSKLARAGIVESSLSNTGKHNEGKINEYECVSIGNIGNGVQVMLKVYGPR